MLMKDRRELTLGCDGVEREDRTDRTKPRILLLAADSGKSGSAFGMARMVPVV